MSDTPFGSAPFRATTLPSNGRADPLNLDLGETSTAPAGLLRCVLASHPNAVVLVDSTGKIVYTEELVGAKGGLKGVDGFLSKPFTPDSLARKVRELVDGPKARA